MRTYLVVFAILLTELLAAPGAFAWGDAGHRIVCQIAYLELRPEAREKVDALIALDPKFRTFSASCIWPDIFPAVRPSEHFLNVPRAATAVDASKLCPVSDRCVASAILGDARDLALSMDNQDKLRLLKSLGHWVGDIHQPLHISFEDDKGGNYVAVSGPCALSLHLAWDLCIIEKKLGADEGAAAAKLDSEITEAQRNKWAGAPTDAGAVASWASESLAIAIGALTHYCVQHGAACWYSTDEPKFAGKKRNVEISDEYLEAQAPIVRDRLKRAGVRLAAILNAVFSNASQ